MDPLSVHADYLWAVCYRMTASAVDADDLVQETFVRALAHPPPDTSRPWRPWLTKVATHLSIDALRARRAKPYPGPWLPEPILTPDPPDEAPLADDRIGLLESATYAFLLAAEALSEQQRAVLILREVFELSGEETAEALAMSADNVKQTLHRAREALAGYLARRVIPCAAVNERNLRAFAQFQTALDRRDLDALKAALEDGAVALTDSGGSVKAALNPIYGADHIARLVLGLQEKSGVPVEVQPLTLNHQLAAWVRLPPQVAGFGESYVVSIDSDGDGRVRTLWSWINPQKLARLRLRP